MFLVLLSSCSSFLLLRLLFLDVTTPYRNIFSSCSVQLRQNKLWERLHSWKHHTVTTPYRNGSFPGNLCLDIKPYGNRPTLGCYNDLLPIIHHADGHEWPSHRCSVLNQFKYLPTHAFFLPPEYFTNKIYHIKSSI